MPAQGNALGMRRRTELQALKGRHRFASNVYVVLSGLEECYFQRQPRALPWAGILLPLRGKENAQHQNLRVGLV
jgi:hypothetical protein